MLKYIFILLGAILLLWGCDQTLEIYNAGQQGSSSESSATDSNDPAQMLIVPGHGVGAISLNSSLNNVKSLLGKPDRDDAAMGSAFISWYNNHDPNSYQIQVYAANKSGSDDETAAIVKKIRITSPLYQTKESVKIGSTYDEIMKQFNLTPNPNPRYKDHYKLYDDLQAGIGFEIRPDGICSAIIVHAPGDNTFTYINLKP